MTARLSPWLRIWDSRMRFTAYLLSLLILSQQSTVRVDVNLQQVRFIAKDGGNATIADVLPHDLVVEENAVRQTITRVARESGGPLSAVLLVTPGNPQHDEENEAATIIGRELIRQMQPQDEILIMSVFDAPPVVARQDVNANAQQIEEAFSSAMSRPYAGERLLGRGIALSRAMEATRLSRHRARALIVITSMSHWSLGSSLSPDGLSRAVNNEREVSTYFFDVGGAIDESKVRPTDVGRTRISLFGFETERNVEFWQNPFTERTGGRAFHFDFNSRTSTRALAHLHDFIQQIHLDLRTSQILEYYSSAPPLSPRRIRVEPLNPDHRI